MNEKAMILEKQIQDYMTYNVQEQNRILQNICVKMKNKEDYNTLDIEYLETIKNRLKGINLVLISTY